MPSETSVSKQPPRVPNPDRFAHTSLTDAMPDAIIIVDADGRIVEFNARAQGMLGYSREEVLGQPVELLLPDRFRQGHVADRARYNERPHVRPMGQGLQLMARCKDGKELPVEISLAPYQSEQGALVVASIREVRRHGPATG
jgi:PAS domain S-box-containing protein